MPAVKTSPNKEDIRRLAEVIYTQRLSNYLGPDLDPEKPRAQQDLSEVIDQEALFALEAADAFCTMADAWFK